MIERFLVVSEIMPRIGRCCVYAKNSAQAAELGRDCIASMIGFYPKSLKVFSTHDDGSAKFFLTRFIF